MEYTVIPHYAVNREAYASLLEECPDATPFHSLDWMPIYELYSRKAHQFLVCAQEGDTLLAAMPVTVFEKFLLRAIFSSGFGVHGGPISRPGCGPHVLAGLLERFARDFHGLRTVISCVHDFRGLAAPLQDMGFTATPVYTHIMSLPRRCADLDKRGQRAARKAARAGIQTWRSKDTGDFRQWQKLCSANYIAHGRRPYPTALYRAVAERIQEGDMLRFYVARLEDRVVGGVVQVSDSRQAYYWMSATDPEFRAYGINDLIFQAVFTDAIDEGIAEFDLGPSPAGAEGLTVFKEKWGGIQKNYCQYSSSNALGRISANIVRYGKFSWN